LVVSIASAASTVPPAEASLLPAQVGLDDETFLTIIFATVGASAGAAVLLTLAYLLRRSLGIDWHRSTGEATHDAHGRQPSHEEVAAGVHEAATGETAEQEGGQP
jgi:hypothetical protein